MTLTPYMVEDLIIREQVVGVGTFCRCWQKSTSPVGARTHSTKVSAWEKGGSVTKHVLCFAFQVSYKAAVQIRSQRI